MQSRRSLLRSAALAVTLAVSITACGQRGGSSSDPGMSVTVFAASSLTAAFTEIAEGFEAANPGSTVTLNFAASSELATQINNGAPADVFASADSKNMGKLTDGTVDAPKDFASNRLEIVVQAGNPKGITGLVDLAQPGLVYVAAAPEVPVGKYAQQVLGAAGVAVTPKSLEANVKGIVSKVTLGEADAGIVYVTDVLAAGSKATGVAIPDASNVIAHYPIAVPATSEHRAAGAAFAAFVLSPAGQQILAKYGFAAP